jgi:prevent-host-death family protein
MNKGMKMPITTLSSREFNQDTSGAKKAADTGPVFITDRGIPSHVLMSIDQYRKLTATNKNIIDLLSMPDADKSEFESDRVCIIPCRTYVP